MPCAPQPTKFDLPLRDNTTPLANASCHSFSSNSFLYTHRNTALITLAHAQTILYK